MARKSKALSTNRWTSQLTYNSFVSVESRTYYNLRLIKHMSDIDALVDHANVEFDRNG